MTAVVPLRRIPPPNQRGFTLIELMVGVVIALIATLVIAQVLVNAEAQKRTATSGSDAQVNGALALYTLQRDLQSAGYGLTNMAETLGCEIRANHKGAAFTWSLVPLLITAGANGAPDRVEVMGSDKLNYSVPALVIKDHPQQAANFFVNSALGIADGDMMLAVPEIWDANHWCSVFQVTNANAGAGAGLGNNQVLHNAGKSDWNQAGGQTIFPADGYPSGSLLVNLGHFVDRIYSVPAAQVLQLQTFNTADGTSTTQALFPHIVQLQAFYGKDTNANGVVDTYDKITPATQAAWAQVLTVRIAVVARSTQFERENVTAANPQWDVGTAAAVAGSAVCGASKCFEIKVDGVADWQRYRYKVFETTVPLRNMLWHS